MQLKPRAAGWAAVMVVALFLAGTLGFWAFDYNQRRALAGSHTSERAIAAGYALTRQIHSVFSDLAYLSQQQRLVRFRPEFREDRVALENSWQLYLERHPYLEQIRYLDSLGREQVRVERRGGEVVAIAEPQLQDKAKRYYFLDAMALAPGQIYLSPLDLNVEYGVLDRPYRAMMRFILRLAPVMPEARSGMLVLNVNADYLLQPLIEDVDASTQVLLADADGRLLLDDSGLPYWRQGQQVPISQLSSSLLYRFPNQELYTQGGNRAVSRPGCGWRHAIAHLSVR